MSDTEPRFRVQIMPNDDIVPRWTKHDTREEAFAAARRFVGTRGYHHVQVRDRYGNILWNVLDDPEPMPDTPQPREARVGPTVCGQICAHDPPCGPGECRYEPATPSEATRDDLAERIAREVQDGLIGSLEARAGFCAFNDAKLLRDAAAEIRRLRTPTEQGGSAIEKLRTIRSWCDDPPGSVDTGGWLSCSMLADLIDEPASESTEQGEESGDMLLLAIHYSGPHDPQQDRFAILDALPIEWPSGAILEEAEFRPASPTSSSEGESD